MTDFDLQQQLIEARRRQYGQQAQFQAPQGQMVGRHYVAPNVLQQLAAGLRSFGGMQGQAMAEQELKDLSQKRQDLQTSEMQALTQALRGTPENAPPEGQQGPVRPAQPGGMEAFYGRAMASPLQSLQQVGMQGQISMAQEQAKRQQQQAEQQRIMGILQQAKTPQEALAAGVPAELVKTYYDEGLGKVKGINIDGQLTNPVTGEAIGTRVAPRVNPATDLLIPDPNNPGRMIVNQQLFGVKKDLAQAGKSTTQNTVINAGPKAFDTELGKLDAEQLGQWRTAAQTAQSVLGTVQNLRDAENAGAYSGGGANTRLAAANMIEGWTGVAPKGLVGSQVYNAEASKLILDRVKALGANPSNADREFIEKTVPQLSQSKEARKQLTDWMEKQAQKSIGLYKKADAYARQNRGLGGFDMFGGGGSGGGNGGVVDFGSLK